MISKTRLIIFVSTIAVASCVGAGLYLFSSGTTAGRPVPAPKTVTFDSQNGDETGVTSGETITIQTEQLKNAGIVTALPSEMVTSESISLSAVGVVSSNAYRDIPIALPAMGRVTSVNVVLGQKVSEGQVLATINSSEFATAQTMFLSARSELENARLSSQRAVKLLNISDESRSSFESARRDMQSQNAALAEATARKQRFERLFAVGAVSRQMLEEENRKYSTTLADAEEARRRHDRATALLEINDESKARIEESERRLRRAEGEYSEARRRLALFGMNEKQIDKLKSLENLLSDFPLRAPVSGEITARNISKGEFVDGSREVLRVTDIENLWVIGQISDKELEMVRIGTKTDVALQSGGEIFATGRVTYISPSVDEKTRTTQVRVEIRNDSRRARIGSYVRMLFGSEESVQRSVPSVPVSAVQILKGNSVVFVPKGREGEFEIRVVRTGKSDGERVPILEGLSLDEEVVTVGGFLLRAEYLKRDAN